MPDKTKFDGSEGSPIDPKIAAKWTKQFRDKNPKKHKAFFFGKDILLRILSQDGNMGIRIYMADKDDGSFTPVIVGADANMNNQLPPNFDSYVFKEGAAGDMVVADDATPCPAYCGDGDPLNGG